MWVEPSFIGVFSDDATCQLFIFWTKGLFTFLRTMNNPQHNRLFVLGGREAGDDEFREAFSKFGLVEDVWTVKDRNTGESKGKVVVCCVLTLSKLDSYS